MIILMKKIILIPLLLSTILLVGCETETEIDRCIEANLANLDLDEYIEKINTYHQALPTDTLKYNVRNILRIQNDYFYSKLSPIEKNFDFCLMDKLGEVIIKDFDMISKKRAVLFESSIYEYCMLKQKESAIKVCHSQGVY